MKQFLYLLVLIPTLILAQNTIGGTFTPAKDYTFALLYKATPTGTEYINRAELDQNGSFTIAMDSSTTAGIYKIVYATPPEQNNFDLIYNGSESINFNFNKDENLEFPESKENKLWISYLHSMDMVNRTISNYYTQKSTDKQAFKSIIKTLKETQTAFEDASKDMMVSVFVKSNAPYIPVAYEDLTTYKNNLQRHYLEPVDFGNSLLQSSDFLVDRVMGFVFGMVKDDNPAYKKQVDLLVNHIGEGQKVIKTILLETVWRNFKNSNNVELANYVSDQYLLELSQQFNYDALTEELMVYKNNTIGVKAQNFKLGINTDGKTKTTTLHDLDLAEQYLIVFWSSSCGHCLEELPQVKKLVANKKDFKVIAIGLEDEADNWEKAIKDYPEFIHVLGLGKWENPISDAYGVEATPSYFLLNKDKIIISKPYDYNELENTMK